MTTLRERVAAERRRLRSVRQKLSAAVAQTSGGDDSYVPFYVAVADYIEAAMERLHAQDVKMGDMIRDKVDTIDDSVKQALAELEERLAGNQEHLQRFLEAGESLKRDGAAAVERFEAVSKAYTDYITANMGHHGGTTDLAGKLFSMDDWEYMAGVSDADMKREQELYDRVDETTPADLEVPAD